MLKLLSEQKLPDIWRAAIIDSSGSVVARTHEMNKFLGSKVTTELLKRMSAASEGSFETSSMRSLALPNSWKVAHHRQRLPKLKVSMRLSRQDGTCWIRLILDFAMVESGKAMLSREPVSLVEVISECTAMIEPLAKERGISLTFPQFTNPWFVLVDSSWIKQCLMNLLSNAVRYNKPNGAIVVECALSSSGSIRVSVRSQRPVCGPTCAVIPAFQSSRQGTLCEQRHGHEPCGDQATYPTDGGLNRCG